ncbi:uncharacterized protein PG986_014567 [Apiospora aurea]|uniref:Uncharacterized protein n=1 Tax=Apiospora aurea TaxID=335848 RepID=A0ABR1PTC5_9PEZI
MAVDLRFWNRWIKSSSDGEDHQVLDLLLDEAVLWCTVVILVTTTAVILGRQLAENAGQEPKEQETKEQYLALLGLLWQALLQLLVNYCAVVPVLREQRLQRKQQQKKKRTGSTSTFSSASSRNQQRPRDVLIRVHYSVFYGCVVASVVATVLAPVLLSFQKQTASNVANFASNIFSAIAASQLAAGITSGLRSQE